MFEQCILSRDPGVLPQEILGSNILCPALRGFFVPQNLAEMCGHVLSIPNVNDTCDNTAPVYYF